MSAVLRPPEPGVTTLDVAALHHRLREFLGPREHWWPVETRTEILLGSVLVQNTNWRNADRSLAALRDAGMLDLDAIAALPPAELTELIRPSGFQTAKARTIGRLAEWAIRRHRVGRAGGATTDDPAGRTGSSRWLGPELVGELTTAGLRAELLSIPGVGPETADVLLLYVFERPVFVADSYARRLFTRLGAQPPRGYEGFARQVHDSVDFTVSQWQEFHGLIDDFAKVYCRTDETWRNSPLGGAGMATPIVGIPGRAGVGSSWSDRDVRLN